MASLIVTAAPYIGEACANRFFGGDLRHVFDDMHCNVLALSKTLGFSVVIMCLVLKLPQILTIMKHRSVKGISQSAFALELWSYSVAFLYGFVNDHPFTAYGEMSTLALQDVIVMFLLFWFNPNGNTAVYAVGFAGYFTFMFLAIFTDVLPMSVFTTLQASSIVVSATSKSMQIYQNFRDQGTGFLSLGSFAMALYGCVVRMLTTFAEVNDMLVMLSFGLSTFLNFVIVAQIIYYKGEAGASAATRKKRSPKAD